jgi:hypothetical protein
MSFRVEIISEQEFHFSVLGEREREKSYQICELRAEWERRKVFSLTTMAAAAAAILLRKINFRKLCFCSSALFTADVSGGATVVCLKWKIIRENFESLASMKRLKGKKMRRNRSSSQYHLIKRQKICHHLMSCSSSKKKIERTKFQMPRAFQFV